MLKEGESQYGIRLIAVNLVSNLVLVENCGHAQSIRLHSFANQPSAPAVGIAEYHELLVQRKIQAEESNPVEGANPDPGASEKPKFDSRNGNNFAKNSGSKDPAARTASGNQSSSATSPISGSPAIMNGPDPASSLKDQADSDWYQDAALMEKNRIATAASVLAGKMDPWPLTPLTPSGTPVALIGDDAIYANHLPGFSNN